MAGLKSKHNQAAAIVADMTLEEKARFCSGKSFWHLESLERHNIPNVMVTDGPHGLRKQVTSEDHVGLNKSVPATCFPTACALASTWDVDLLEEIGVALGNECRAENVTVLLGPGVNIKRHPCCGRNFEYFSEDPLLTGKLAGALIKGVQSRNVGTSIKHYAVNNQEHGRMYIDAIVDERTLREIYLRGFEIAVREAQPWTVMCAYNRVNGTFCSEHDWLLNKVLREEWGFEGLVVTDWGAANDRVAGIQGGLDLEMPGGGRVNDERVLQAVQNGNLAEADLDRAIQRNVALGLLGADLEAAQDVVDLEANHALAHRAACQSAVLLKNDDALLPLGTDQRIAVIGAFAKRPRYQGAGSSQVNPTQLDNAWDAINEFADTEPAYAAGYDPKTSELDETLIAEAVAAAETADVAVIYAGLPSIYESEGFDRSHIDLPEQHNQLIAAVTRANPNTVVVLANGAPVAMPWVDAPKAILEAYLPGQAGGAVADLLYGRANPCGKLAETFPLSRQDVAADANFPGSGRQVLYREGLFVGYRYFDSADIPVLFPFGHGLSYTSFTYANAEIAADAASVSVEISNTGNLAGAEIVQLYVHASTSPVFKPEQELKGFKKIFLAPGEARTVTFSLNQEDFAYYDIGHADWVSPGGDFEVRIGASSRDIRAKLTVSRPATATPSEAATAAQPAPGAADDETFAALLNKAVPQPEPVRPFHMNSSLAEVGETWLGARFKARVAAAFLGNMGGSGNDETLNKMFEEMANNMPLRALILFGRGQVSHKQLELMLALLNHRYLRALRIWLGS